eukprot:2020812-Rhodomonas_salina.2
MCAPLWLTAQQSLKLWCHTVLIKSPKGIAYESWLAGLTETTYGGTSRPLMAGLAVRGARQ